LDSEVRRAKAELAEFEARNRDLSSQVQMAREQMGRLQEEASDMQMARLGAIKGGTEWALCFSADGTFSSYTIRDDSGTDRTLCTADDPKPYRKSVDSASIHSEVTYVENFSGSKLFFTPQGTSISGNVTLSSDSRSQQVTVNGMTGNIRIQ
jgi:hypothetical protein